MTSWNGYGTATYDGAGEVREVKSYNASGVSVPSGNFAQDLGCFPYGHLSHQKQSEGLAILAESSSLAFPRRTDPPGVIALITPATWQSSSDLAAKLHDVEMVPIDLLSVVIGLGQTPAPRTSLRLPDLLGVLNPQVHPTLCSTEDAFSHSPTQAKPQQLSKQLFR